ncbi:MAG: hypothetical protein HQL19_06520 [Candidatus Omnitrophica bacterium]|nr:hypothetical protein [Candidatus Omnitrophota bacterium]
MNKQFDCVEFKHAAARRIHQEIGQLGGGEELRFWKRRGAVLRNHKRKAVKVSV